MPSWLKQQRLRVKILAALLPHYCLGLVALSARSSRNPASVPWDVIGNFKVHLLVLMVMGGAALSLALLFCASLIKPWSEDGYDVRRTLPFFLMMSFCFPLQVWLLKQDLWPFVPVVFPALQTAAFVYFQKLWSRDGLKMSFPRTAAALSFPMFFMAQIAYFVFSGVLLGLTMRVFVFLR